MLIRRFLVPFVLLVFGIAAAHPAAADSGDDAMKFIDDFGHRAIASLTSSNLSDEELTNRFRVLFEEGFDVPFIAKSALGRFWPRASDAERTQYIPLFEDYIVEIYASQFRGYVGQGFKPQSAHVDDSGFVTVFSDVTAEDGTVTKLQWIVVNISGKPRIRDILIEGVSMIQTYRDQFANEILQHDGKVAGLLDALREKTASLKTHTAGSG